MCNLLKIWFYPLILMILIIITTISCKKNDNDTDNQNTITDIDGNIYHSVNIGSQIWLIENLKTTHYQNGDSITNVKDKNQWGNLTSDAYCDYNNDTNYVKIYGHLYNWYAVNNKKICPVGWHVPSDSELKILCNYLGGDSVAGGKLKEAGTVHWLSPNTDATNESGFTGLPIGRRYNDGTYSALGLYGYWWSTSETLGEYAYCLHLENQKAKAFHFALYKKNGFSVCCIKDQ